MYVIWKYFLVSSYNTIILSVQGWFSFQARLNLCSRIIRLFFLIWWLLPHNLTISYNKNTHLCLNTKWWFLFCSSHIFVFWFLVFWSLYLRDFLSRFAHLALQNVNKDYVIFLYFRNFVAKSDQKPKTNDGMNQTIKS